MDKIQENTLRTSVAESIIKFIGLTPGITSVQLGLKVLQEFSPKDIGSVLFADTIRELILIDAIVGIFYFLPEEIIAKEIYFPKGTKINIR